MIESEFYVLHKCVVALEVFLMIPGWVWLSQHTITFHSVWSSVALASSNKESAFSVGFSNISNANHLTLDSGYTPNAVM